MLKFLNRDLRDHSKESIAQRRHLRMKGKSLKQVLLDRFLNNYGYDKGIVIVTAIIDDLLTIIENYYRFSDNSFVKNGQMVWHAVPIHEYPKKENPWLKPNSFPSFWISFLIRISTI